MRRRSLLDAAHAEQGSGSFWSLSASDELGWLKAWVAFAPGAAPEAALPEVAENGHDV